MRILQLNSYADPIGGAEVYALALTRELGRRGHVVGFFGTSPDREADEERLRVVRRPRYDVRVLYRDPVVRSALEEYVERLRPDVVHVHNVFSLGVDVLEFLGSTGIPLLQTVHDFSLLCPNSWCVRGDGTPCAGVVGSQCFQHDCQKNYPYDPEVALHTLLKQRTMAGIVALAICPSRYLANLMRNSGSGDVRHLNYFIDPIASEVVERRTRELIFIGRLEPEKGVEYLLEAMPLMLRAEAELRLTIVGGGSLAEELTAKAEGLHLGNAVTFLSHVPRAELGRFYATATACVLPSIWSENSPLVAYECLAAGLPMIGSRVGGIPELVEEGEAGFTFTARDPHDLADKTLRLLALPTGERLRMSSAMRERARDFRIPAHVDRIEELYAEILPGPRPPTRAGLPIDQDLLTVLARHGAEKQRLGALYHEHVTYIRQLEQTLSAQGLVVSSAEEHGKLIHELELSLDQHRRSLAALESEGPGQLLRRLARRLHLPKVFKG